MDICRALQVEVCMSNCKYKLSSKLLYWLPSQYTFKKATKTVDRLHLEEFSSAICTNVKQVLNNNEINLPEAPLNYLNKIIKLQLLMGYQDVNKSFGIGKKGTKCCLLAQGGIIRIGCFHTISSVTEIK